MIGEGLAALCVRVNEMPEARKLVGWPLPTDDAAPSTNRCRPPSEQFYTDRWRQWAQTPQLRATRSREGSMSKADQFREYAEEAMRGARQSKTEKERQALIELACTWTQAAVQSEHIFGVNHSPPEHRAL